jgi:anti-sigma B factor antagonist
MKVIKDGVKRIVLDLSKIEYIDSTGIGIIAYCFGKIGQAGAACRVSGAHGLVMDLFKITRLASVIQFLPDVESACASFEPGAAISQA